MRIKRLRLLLVELWQPVVLILLGVLLISFLLFYKLSSLTPGLSTSEVISHNAASSVSVIVRNPVYAPYKLLSYLLSKTGLPIKFSIRAASAAFAALTIGLFYYIVSRWHSTRVALFGSFLFASSAWLLHYARYASPDISSTLLLAALAYGHWFRKTKRSVIAVVIGSILVSSLMYVPGMIWVIILAIIWQRKQVKIHLRPLKYNLPLVIVITALLLVPLVYGVIRQPSLIKILIGLPATGLPKPYDFLRHLINVPVQIFVRGAYNPTVWLGRLPLLDVFSSVILLLGIYSYYHKRQLDRAKLLAGSLVIGSLLVALHGSVSIIILAPTIYLLMSSGVGYLLNQWLMVYPRNPLARGIGIGLVSLLIAMCCFYNLKQYFVAWPSAPATKRVFQQQL